MARAIPRHPLNEALLERANSAKGDQKRLICSRSKQNKAKADLRRTFSDKCNWPYYIVFEECIEGWIIFSGHLFHNHELILTTGSSLSQSSLRFVPDQPIEMEEICKRAGYSPVLINCVLQSESFHQNIEIGIIMISITMRALLGSHLWISKRNGGSYANVKTLIQLIHLTKREIND